MSAGQMEPGVNFLRLAEEKRGGLGFHLVLQKKALKTIIISELEIVIKK